VFPEVSEKGESNSFLQTMQGGMDEAGNGCVDISLYYHITKKLALVIIIQSFESKYDLLCLQLLHSLRLELPRIFDCVGVAFHALLYPKRS